MYKKYFKRLIDIFGSLFLILLLSPVFIILWIVLRVKMGNPVIFRQRRPGKNEKPFYLLKFRSMADLRDEKGNLLSDEKRILPLGKFLRKTSLDELPQFWNVLKGDMSFIGPRPLLERYLPYYTQEEKMRHSVRPGISGLAQVKGRNCISWNDKLALDIEYVKNVNFINDLKIALLTIKGILFAKGVEVVSSENFLDEERKNSLK